MSENTEVVTPKEESKGEHVEKLLKEKKNAMEALRAQQDENKALQAKLKDISDKDLMAKEDFKTIIDNQKKEIQEWQSKATNLEVEKVNGAKTSHLKRELEKMGARTEVTHALLKLANLDVLKYDDEHKVVLGVEEEAKRIKEIIPDVFGKQSAGVNHGAPNTTGPAKLDIESFKSMSLEDKRKNFADLMKQQGIVLRK